MKKYLQSLAILIICPCFYVHTVLYSATHFLGGDSDYFTYNAFPDLDIAHSKMNVKKYHQTGEIRISGVIINNGRLAIQSFNLVYQVDQQIPVTHTVNPVSIAATSLYDYSHPVRWNVAKSGTYTLKVWTENVNGQADMDRSNDTIIKKIIVLDPVPDILDSYLKYKSNKKIIADPLKAISQPRDLDFHPDRNRYELWVINKSTAEDGGMTVKISNAGKTNQTHLLQQDGNAWHFMSLPTGIAFSDNENFATSPGVYDANHNGGEPFTGPTLWSSDPAVYAVPVPGGNGSHLDMLHQSPYSMGICHETDNVFWIADGSNGDLVRYDFGEDHGPGQHDHSDGIIRRYPDAEFYAEPTYDVVSHLSLDKKTNWLYYVSTSERKVKRLNIKSGSFAYNIPPYEPVKEYSVYFNSIVETVVSGGASMPSGLEVFNERLLVTDFVTGDIYFYDITSTKPSYLGKVETNSPGIMGITVGPDGKIWYVNKIQNQVVRLDTTTVLVSSNDVHDDVSFDLFPDPAKNSITLQFDKAPGYLEIIDINSRIIKIMEIKTQKEIIDISDLPSGMYLAKYTCKDAQKIIKWIKQ